ncbi:MAG: RNA polymerase sigma factor [Chthonomonadales bacterium]|nr:RNA polymerase sigma factor [Chthonomonadales bacterium]
MTDGELVARAVDGDPGAYDDLFRRHYARVYNLALRLDGNHANAEDIAQTAFLRAHGSLGRLRDGQAFLKFVYRIAVNLVRDRAKAARRRPLALFGDLWRPGRQSADEGGGEDPRLADVEADPARRTVELERDRALLAAIAALSLDQREVVVLHHLEGLGVRQIAETLGVREGTVFSRLGRARQRLREALRGWFEAEEET